MPKPRSVVELRPPGQPSLDPVSADPLHRQLRNQIANVVVEQAIAPGVMLPGEHSICRDFGVSRTVVRQALAQLEDEGLIERVKGKGTFVARRRVPEGLAHNLLGLYDEAQARGSTVRSDVRRLEWVEPGARVTKQLKVPAGENVLLLERLRFVDGEPWSLSTTWLPATVGEWVIGEDLSNASLYQVLRGHGRWAASGTRSVEAATANLIQAELLGVEIGAPLLVLHSTSLDQSGAPLEVFTAYHRGDRTRFEFNLKTMYPDALRAQEYSAEGGFPAMTVAVSSLGTVPGNASQGLRPES